MSLSVDKFNDYLRGKKIAIIGAGVSNVPLISYLAKLSDRVVLFDRNELSDEVLELVREYDIDISIGDNYLEQLVGFEVIFRSPSCLPTNPYLVLEQKRGALVTTEVEQVIRLAPCKVIGITGSDGKTTTTTLISLLLEGLGYKVYKGGNIGNPIFTCMDKVMSEDIIVLELSSFQLMGMEVSPNVAVITNISPNHLDIHKDYQEYISAKKNIFRWQKNNDMVVLNYDDKLVRDFAKESLGEVRFFSESQRLDDCYYLDGDYIRYNDKIFLDVRDLKVRGRHNYINICTALNAIRDYISDEEIVSDILLNFTGVEHRIEFVREIDGVKWYNDSASSSPSRTIAGIKAFSENVILIAGGYDKNIPYDVLAGAILDKVRVLILFGNTKDKIYKVVMDEMKKRDTSIEIYRLNTIDEVINKAREVAYSGEVVLFSPASASFDMFKNAYERGNIFKDMVNKLN